MAMTHVRRLLGPIRWCLSLALVVCGCGDSRQLSVSGRVALDGKPLGDGQIAFVPASGPALPVGSLIKEGRYALPNPRGLPRAHTQCGSAPEAAATSFPATSPI
jgi:hypothetical protein